MSNAFYLNSRVAVRRAPSLQLLNEHGLPAVCTQTGGRCAAIEVQLETGHTLLIY
jgi:hypothetical protein